MQCRAVLGGRTLTVGTMPQVRQAVAEAVTARLSGDPEGVAAGAHAVNLAFSDDSLEMVVRAGERWTVDIGGSQLVIEGVVNS